MTDNDCGLGIAVKSYLDELAASPDPTSENARAMAKAKGPKEWLMFSEDFEGDLKVAFGLWDAVCSSPNIIRVLVADQTICRFTREYKLLEVMSGMHISGRMLITGSLKGDNLYYSIDIRRV
jgi:hypothetical protein